MAEETPKIIGILIDRTQKKLKLSMTRKLQEMGADITVEQWVLLDRLREQDGQTQNELADGTFKDAPNVSRIINLLCKKGLTRRKADKKDRRRVQIWLTPEGKALIKLALPGVEEVRQNSWQGLSEQDYQDAVRILNQVYDNLQ